MSETEKSFKERWDNLSDDEKIYVYQNLKNMGPEMGNRVLKLTTPEEIKRLGYRIATGESVYISPDKFEIPAGERAKLMFARDPNVSVEYLNKNLPQYEFKNYFGDIVARQRGSKDKFGPIDPEWLGGGNWKDKATEFVQDMGDIAWPAARGTTETLAAMAGGLGGGIAGALAGPMAAGAGALTGAAIAGGETTAAMSRAEADIASALGFVQPKPTAVEQSQDRFIGGLFSLLGGTGVGAYEVKQLAKTEMFKNLAKRRGLSPLDLEKELLRSQSGVPVKTVRAGQNAWFGPLGGNSLNEMRLLRNRLEKVKEMEKADDPFSVLISEKRRKLEDQIKATRGKVSQKIIDAAPDDKMVSTKGIYDAWWDEIERLKADPNLNAVDQEVISDLEEQFLKEMSKFTDEAIDFGYTPEGILIDAREFMPDEISAKNAARLSAKMRQMDDQLQQFYRRGISVGDPKQRGAGQFGNSLSKISRNAIDYLDSQIEKVSGSTAYKDAKKDYGHFSRIERELYGEGILTDKKFFNVAEKLTNKSSGKFRSAALALDNSYGTEIIPELQDLVLYTKFGKNEPLGEAISLGVTPVEKSIAGTNVKRSPASAVGAIAGWQLGSNESVGGGPESYMIPAGSAAAGAYLGNFLTSPYFARRFMSKPAIPATRFTPEIPWNAMAKPGQVAGRAADYRQISPEAAREISNELGVNIPGMAESSYEVSTPYPGAQMLPPRDTPLRDLFEFQWQKYPAQPFSFPGEWQRYQGLDRSKR